MSLFDRILGRVAAPAPAGRTFVVPPRPFINTHALDAAGLRRGMWAKSTMGHGLAIITGARIDGMAEITLQKQNGTTLMELDEQDQAVPAVRVVEMSTLRMAYIEEIPESRHEGADHLRSFGYISASEVA